MMTSEQENGNHSTTIDVQEVEEVQKLNISVEPGSLFQMPSSSGNLMSGDVKETADKVLGFLGMFPDYLTEAYTVADGILDRLNTIPLFAPTFELVGLGFTGWFIFRYLLYAASRQELKQEIDVVKNRIVGSLQQHEEKND